MAVQDHLHPCGKCWKDAPCTCARVRDLRTDALRAMCECVIENETPDEDDIDDLLASGRMLACELLRLLDEGMYV